MKTIFLNDLASNSRSELKPSVMALGFFDGIHLGHQKLIEKAKEISKQKKLELSVLTFFPHPKEILSQEKFHYLIPLEKKIEILRDMGVERLYVVRFDKEFASLAPELFVKEYLLSLHVKEVVAGFDFTYGSGGLGTMQTLEANGKGAFLVNKLSKVELNGNKISSTLIRKLLSSGQVNQIADYLGDYYQTQGYITNLYPIYNLKTVSRIRYYVSAFNTLPNAGTYEADVLIKKQWVRCICHVFLTKAGKVTVEMKIPREINIRNREEVTIKWLSKCSEKTTILLKHLNG